MDFSAGKKRREKFFAEAEKRLEESIEQSKERELVAREIWPRFQHHMIALEAGLKRLKSLLEEGRDEAMMKDDWLEECIEEEAKMEKEMEELKHFYKPAVMDPVDSEAKAEASMSAKELKKSIEEEVVASKRIKLDNKRGEMTKVEKAPPRTKRHTKITSNSHMEGSKNQVAGDAHQQVDADSTVGNHQALKVNQQEKAGMLQLMQALIWLVQQQTITENNVAKFIEFMRLAPLPFKGTLGPLEAENWLKEMEKVFAILKCTEEEKVAYTSYMLQGRASDWWEIQCKYKDDAKPFTWERFHEAFYEKYFPRFVLAAKEQEFCRLNQGGMTVAQYEAKFTELAKFAPHPVEDEEVRAKIFQLGLRSDIRMKVLLFDLNTYQAVVNKALLIERGINEAKMEESTEDSASVSDASHGRIQHKRDISSYRCGGPHYQRECRYNGACFSCGQYGHKAVVCPRRTGPQ